ncbi:AzlC family ABC transporter permease [Acinetobacter piscicola]|uniref:AzlC family ABC transporter permease n=1 Tax=Acinetobacter piscicola TaxID=2006115 RepID=UPI000B7E0130|nr:AzlC family ABC transporter permease [Acinetobacter piscicola]
MNDQFKSVSHQAVPQKTLNKKAFFQGVMDILPLSIAVLPWGILAGSMAINAGLSFAQAFSMSAIVFAGAAQLVSLGLVMSNASVFTIIITIFFLTSQHLIYALNFRKEVSQFPTHQRLMIGFLLTDELFAVGIGENKQRTFAYLFGAGLCFYLAWCLFSLLGILLAQSIPNLESLHLDFSIVAVFILIIVPMIKNIATLFGVVVTLISACIFKYLQFEGGVVLSGLLGMLGAMSAAKMMGKIIRKRK